MAFLITTTGTTSPVIFNDLGDREFAHPTVAYNLEDEYTIDEIRGSIDLFAAITAGDIIATYNGNTINTPADLTFVVSNDNRLVTYNVLVVKKNPGVNEFLTIADAIATISTASVTNPFVIKVSPGVFVEPELNLPSYVSIEGATIESTVIMPVGNHHIFNLTNPNVEITFLNLTGSQPGYAGLYINDLGDFAQAHKVTFNDCAIGVIVESITQDTFFYGEYIDFNGDYSNGVKVIANNGFESFASLENYYNFAVGPTATVGTSISGPGADAHIGVGAFTGAGAGLDTGFYLEDGAEIELSSIMIDKSNIGVHIANVGSPCNIIMLGSNAQNSTTNDILIEHPGTTGNIQGSFDMSKVSLDSSAVSIVIQDNVLGELNISKKLNIRFNETTSTDVSTLIIESSTMGVMEGGQLSDGGGFVLNVAAGFGYREEEPEILHRYDWLSTSITIPANSFRYVFFNTSDTLSLSATLPDTRYNIVLGSVSTHSTGIEFVNKTPMNAEHTVNLLHKFFDNALGPIYASGSIVVENVTPFHLNVGSGQFFIGQNEFNPSGGTDITFTSYYKDGLGDWVRTSTNVIDNSNYDDGSGTLAAIPSGKYVKHSLYVVGDGAEEKYFMVYAENYYSTLLDTQQATLPVPPTQFEDGVTLLAGIIIKEGDANIVQIRDLRPVVGFRSEGVNASADHGSLLGLLDDDHPQYLLTNGGRTLTGSQDYGGNNITNINLINGISISTHASRHLPNGADPLTTAAPTANLGGSTTNAVGIQNSFARSDHSHAIDQASASVTGLLKSTDWTTFNNKENAITVGTTLQYWRGDKTFQTLNTTVVPEGTHLYFTTARVDTQVATYTGDVTLSGTVFSIGSSKVTNTMLVNSAVTINGSSIALGNSITITASTTNALTVDNSSLQLSSGTSFDGSVALTISVKALGITNAMLAGSIDLTTKVTGVLPSTNGGTGVNNGSNTITLAGNLITTGAFNTTFAQSVTGIMTLPTVAANLVGSSGALTSGRVPFVTTNGVLIDSGNITYNSTSGKLLLGGGNGGDLLDVTLASNPSNQIGLLGVRIKTSIGGTTSGVQLKLLNENNQQLSLFLTSSGFTSTGLLSSSQGTLKVDTGDMLITSNNIQTIGGVGKIIFTGGGTATTNELLGLNATQTGNWIDILKGSRAITKWYNAAGFALTLQTSTSMSADFTMTLPTSNSTGTQALVNDGTGVLTWVTLTTGTVTSVSGTTNRITSTGGATPVIDIAATYVGQTSITTLGTITTGTWQGTAVANGFIATTLSSKTLDNTNTVTLKDTLFTLQDDGDTTKQLLFQLSGITTATTRTLTAPDANGVISIRDSVLKSTVTTTTNAATTIQTIPTATDTGYLIEVRAISRRVSGTGTGANGNTNAYVRTVKAKNVGGTLTLGTVQSDYTDEDIAIHNVTITTSGTNVLVQVTGSTNNTINWEAIIDIVTV